MTVQNHSKLTTSMLITKLGQHSIIFGKPWIKKHGVILDTKNDQLTFWPRHCQYTKELHAKQPRAEKPHAEEPCAKEPQAGKPINILKQQLDELLDILPYLLPSTQGVSKVANTLEAVKLGKKKKPSTKAQKPKSNAKDKTEGKGKTKVKAKDLSIESADEADKSLDLALIDETPFMHLAKKQKVVEIFSISMQDIEYQLNKVTKPLTNPKTVVTAEYHDFFDVFSKETSDTLSPHTKFDYKIKLLKDAGDLGHSALQEMLASQLKFVKKFLEEHLKKKFIEASSASCLSSILMAKKLGSGIRFCVGYRKLNSLTKKDAYPLPLIAETIARLKKAVIFTKIDIRQALHKLCIAIESEDATTFASRFRLYKWKVMPFRLTGGSASWQRFINNLLWEYLNDFCTAYLDDIFIYSTIFKDHKQHVRKVLMKLQEAEI